MIHSEMLLKSGEKYQGIVESILTVTVPQICNHQRPGKTPLEKSRQEAQPRGSTTKINPCKTPEVAGLLGQGLSTWIFMLRTAYLAAGSNLPSQSSWLILNSAPYAACTAGSSVLLSALVCQAQGHSCSVTLDRFPALKRGDYFSLARKGVVSGDGYKKCSVSQKTTKRREGKQFIILYSELCMLCKPLTSQT